jgi:probable rRNA maturation factor
VTVVDTPLTRRDARGLARWLERAAPRGAQGEVAIAILSDSRVRAFNRAWRGVDAVTDVLSFPAGPDAPADPGGGTSSAKSNRFRYLGDIAIAAGVARRQAAAERHSVATELRVLALHGLLHLLGYDHEQDHGEMRRLEDRLRRRAGLPTSLIMRASRHVAQR